MMKILHILCTDRLSGAERVHLDILSKLKDENEVVYASPDGPVREAVESAGVRFIPCDTDSVRVLKELYKREKPDVVHAADPRMSFKCAIAGIPFISHLHNNCPWMKKLSLNSLALKFAVSRADSVIAVSDSVIDDYIFKSSAAGKTYIIPNVVDRNRVERMADADFDSECDVLFVGRFTEQKRPLLFLEFVKKLTERIPTLTAIMLGEGELLPESREYAAKNSIKNVSFLGFDPNPYRIMAKSKLIVFTSHYEGFGLVAVEGMILGKPFLAYPVGGIAKIAEGGGVTVTTLEGSVDAAYRLLTDRHYYSEASAKAEKCSRCYTDVENYIEKIKSIYAKSVERRRNGR